MVPLGWPSRSTGPFGPAGAGWVGDRVDSASAMLSFAASTTLSAVKPNSSNSLAPAALAPYWLMLRIRPWSPTSSRQPVLTPASTLTRALMLGGTTESR